MPHLVTNAIDTDHVRETTNSDGERILIAEDVPLVKPMELAGGYVPEDHLRASTADWHGEEITLRHPRNEPGTPWYDPSKEDGAIISATENDAVVEGTVLGTVRSPSWDGEFIRGDIHVNVDDARALGDEGAQVVDKLESGGRLDVSTQYYAEPLQPGVYDGEYRQEVEGNITPDSVAVLPNGEGVCSVADGCGIPATAADTAMATANSDTRRLRVPITADDPETGEDGDAHAATAASANASTGGISYSGTRGGTLDESAIPDDDYASHYVFDADTKSESSFPLVDAEGNLRAGNVAAAFRFRDDAPDRGALLDVLESVNDAFDDPPIDPESLEEAMSSNSAGVRGWVRSFLGLTPADTPTDASPSDDPAESGTDSQPGTPAANNDDGDDGGQTTSTSARPETMDNRDDLIDEIVSNSALTAASLEDACDERVQLIYDDVTANGADDDGTDSGTDAGTTTETDSDMAAAVMEKLDSLESQMVTEDQVEEMVANATEQTETEDQVERIIANSMEYDADDRDELLQTPQAVRDRIERSLGSASTLPGTGASANAQSDDLDIDDVGTGAIN